MRYCTSCSKWNNGIICIRSNYRCLKAETGTDAYIPDMHSHFLWLNSPHSGLAPSLINQDAYSLVQWDEQSAWQAGSYSFLTPASTEWCNRTRGPLPFLLLLFFLCFPLPYIYSPFCALSCFLFPPSLLFPAQSPSPSTTPSSHTHAHLYSLALSRSLPVSLSLSLFQSPLFPNLHYTQLRPSIIHLLTLWLPHFLLFRIMTTTPSILHTPFPHLPPLWPVKCNSPHTFFPSPFPSLSSPKLTGL